MPEVAPRQFYAAYTNAPAQEDLLGLRSWVGDGVFATHSGGVGRVLRIAGVNYETMTAEAIDKVWQRAKKAFRAAIPGFRIYQYLIKRVDQGIHRTLVYSNDTVHEWIDARNSFIEADGLATVELYIVLVYEPGTFRRLVAFAKSFRAASVNDRLLSRLRGSIEILQDVSTQIEARLEPIGAKLLNKIEAAQFFADYFNPDQDIAASVPKDRNEHIGYYLSNSPIQAHDKSLMLGEHRYRVFAMKAPPNRTLPEDRAEQPFILRELQRSIPSHLAMVSEWIPERTKNLRDAIKTKRRIRGGQQGISEKNGNVKNMSNVEAQDDVEDLGEAQRHLRRQPHGSYSLTVLIFDEDEDRLARSATAIKSFHWDGEFIEITERKMRLAAFLCAIPGNAAFNFFSNYLSLTQYADLSFLFRLDSGSAINSHDGGEYQSAFLTEDNTAHLLSLNHGQLAHASVIGAARAGKSALVNQLIGDSRKRGGFTWIIDIGGSYYALTKRFGGQYMSVNVENWRIKINPWSHEPTDRHIEFLHQFVRMLILNEGREIRPDQDRDIEKRVKGIYGHNPAKRCLSQLNEILPGDLKGSLHRWVGRSPLARIFDNAEDEFSVESFQTIDFARMKQDWPQAITPLRFYFFHRIDQVINDPQHLHAPKALYIDEGWEFILPWIQESLKTWPKMNARITFITQSDADLDGKFYSILNETCPNQFFLPNPRADLKVYAPRFHFTEREEYILHNIAQPQFLLKTPEGSHLLRNPMEPGWKVLYEDQQDACAREFGQIMEAIA